jgi:hypothetical protein
MSFALRATQPCFKSPLIGLTFALPSCLSLLGQTKWLPISFQHSRVWFDTARPPQSIRTHRLALFVSFRTYITHLLPTAILLTGDAFGNAETSLTWACIDEPLLAQLRRSLCFGRITAVILMRLCPHFLFSTYTPLYGVCKYFFEKYLRETRPGIVIHHTGGGVSNKKATEVLTRYSQ